MVETFPPDARVWVYQSSRAFSPDEVEAINRSLAEFTRAWTSHNQQLQAAGEVRYNRFVVLAVDESRAGASGCSIDKSVAFMKHLQSALGVDFFDRMRLAYLGEQGEALSMPREEFAALYAQGVLDENTPVFDPLVDNVGRLNAEFIKPLGQSWHKRMV